MAILLAAWAPSQWSHSPLRILVKTDSQAVLKALQSYRSARSSQHKDRSSIRAYAAAIMRAEQHQGIQLQLEHVRAHRDPAIDDDAFWNDRADQEARNALESLDHNNDTHTLSLVEVDGPVTVHHLGKHVTGDVRTYVSRIIQERAAATAAEGHQGEVLRHVGPAVLRQAAVAISETAPADVQMLLIRMVTSTLPTFARLLANHAGQSVPPTRRAQAWLRNRWHQDKYRTAQAMKRTGPNGTLISDCVLCDENVAETTAHFMTCEEEKAQREVEWIHAVSQTLQELNILISPRTSEVAELIWKSFTDQPTTVHWAARAGLFTSAEIRAALPDDTHITNKTQIKALRVAMIYVVTGWWRRRDKRLRQHQR